MNVKIWLGSLLLLAGTPAAGQEPGAPTGGEAANPSGVVATVNGEPIYFQDLERRLGGMHSGVAETDRGAPDLDQLMFRMVNDALLAQEARALGMQDEEGIRQQVEKLRLDLALSRLEREEISGRAVPTEEEIREAYRQEYRKVTLRMVTAHERDEAEQLLALLREEGADFDAIARERSIDHYATRGGLVKELARIDLPRDLAETAFGMEPGQMAGPIRTAQGWAIVRVESFADADPADYDAEKGEVAKLIRFRKAEALRAELDKRLEELHPAVVDREKLDAIDCEQLPSGRLIPKVEDSAAVLVRLGDRVIRVEQLERALKTRWKGVRNREAALAAKPIVLDRLIRNERMLAEALRRGYGDTEALRRTLRAYETELLVPRFLEEVVGAGIEVTDEEVRAFYDENRTEFPLPPRVHVGQITVAAREEADRVAGLLRDGADLAWLARQQSIDRFREAGGDRGWMVPSRGVDPVQDALYDARPGDVLGPIGAPGNFVVLHVDAREEQGFRALEEVSGTIRSAVYLQKFEQALDEVIQKLRSRSEIRIDEQVLDSLRITGTPAEPGESDAEAPPAAHGGH